MALVRLPHMLHAHTHFILHIQASQHRAILPSTVMSGHLRSACPCKMMPKRMLMTALYTPNVLTAAKPESYLALLALQPFALCSTCLHA